MGWCQCHDPYVQGDVTLLITEKKNCPHCEGTGKIEYSPDEYSIVKDECPICDGTGEI